MIEFVFGDEQSTVSKSLKEQLDLYPLVDSDTNPHLVVNVNVPGFFKQFDIKTTNPSIHNEIEGGFILDHGFFKVSFCYQNDLLISGLSIPPPKAKTTALLHKFLTNIEYSTIEEMAAQICFENVIVPSIYMDDDKFLVHSAGLSDNQNKGVLIGGTGGIGKTSLEIELCTNHGYKFLNDDIAVVSKNGFIYPNLSFPKIYGYNLVNAGKLKNSIFRNRSLLDRLSWKYRYHLKGASKVRRKISPKSVFSVYEGEHALLDRYFILFRDNTTVLSKEMIDAKSAAQMTLNVILAEYADFNNHILWHEFNNQALKHQPVLSLELLKTRWLETMIGAFDNVKCYVVRVPLNLPHNSFLKQASDIIA